jgi:hypothetical protein
MSKQTTPMQAMRQRVKEKDLSPEYFATVYALGEILQRRGIRCTPEDEVAIADFVLKRLRERWEFPR